MTLEESINYYKEKTQNCNSRVNEFIYGVKRCKQEKEEYTQLINWLHELQERRKVDSCEGCVNESGKSHLLVCCTCRRHYHYADLYKPERRTDE